MKKSIKIYSKKGFRSGIIFFLIGSLDLLVMLIKPSANFGKNLKMLLLALLLFIIGTIEITRSIDAKKTQQDEQIQDERAQLLQWRTDAVSFKITWYFCIVLEIILIIVWYFTKMQSLLFSAGIMGLLVNFMIVLSFAVSVFLDKRT